MNRNPKLLREMLCVTAITFAFSSTSLVHAQAPLNDACTGAISLAVGPNPTTCTPVAGSTINAITSSVPSTCAFAPGADVWYSFVASHNSHVIELSNVVSNNPAVSYYNYSMGVYTGSCSSLSSVNCTSGSYISGNAPNIQLSATGLTIGQTYYLRVWEGNAYNSQYLTAVHDLSFNVCVLPPVPPPPIPVNDECVNAIDISNGNLLTASNVSATYSVVDAGSCAWETGPVANDVWFKVIAPSSGNINVVNTVNNNEDLVLEILSNNCTAPQIIDCQANTFFWGENSITFPAVGGETYLIRVYGYDGTNTDADFKIKVGGIPLAVTMGKLEASITATNLPRLKWETYAESGNKGFEIERSNDAKSFYKIGFVNSLAISGNSNEKIEYSFTDVAASDESLFYRVKQMNIDGTYSYSNIEKISFRNTLPLSCNAVPNPATNSILFLVSQPPELNASLKIFDASGRFIRQTNVTSKETRIDISDMATGYYWFHYTDGDFRKIIKVQKN